MGTQPKWHSVLPLLFLGVAIPFDDPTFPSSQKTTFASASLAPSYFGNGGPKSRSAVCGTEGNFIEKVCARRVFIE